MVGREYDTMPEHIERQTMEDYRRDWLEAHGYLPAPPAPPGTHECAYCGRSGLHAGERCPICGRP